MQEPPKEKQKEKDAVGFPVWKLSLTPPTTYHHVGGFRKHKRISLRFCRLEVQVSLGLNPGIGRAVFLLEALAADFRGSPHLPEVASCSLPVSCPNFRANKRIPSLPQGVPLSPLTSMVNS